ncbi:gasdermin-A [Heteronotia binoei]|uniref:gasdermin-A n=1 Tax=Heteronotia binoei TaxID=13085 RepID=UPI00292EE95C|nr:gasdermin-A [Heteronotia binoei]
MFHKTTKSLAKQLDPEGDLIPVRCLVDQNHFRPLCLVQKKSKVPWWQKDRYHKTGYSLLDVLLPEEHASQPDIKDEEPVTIVDHMDGRLEGDLTAPSDLAILEIKSSASMSHARSVKVKKRHIDAQVLDSLNVNSKINLDHPLINQSEKLQRDLYIISETVETVEAAEFRDSSKTEGSILTELRLKAKFTGLRDSKKAVIVPKACTLAFRVKRLLIREGALSILIFPDDPRQTFFSSKDKYQADAGMRFGGSKKVNQLMEIKQECVPLLSLSTDLCGKFFNGFLVVIRNSDLLQELELQLEQALDGINPIKLKTSRPELKELVDNLQDPDGAICSEVAESVLYFLQALDELSESEMLLLEESVERKIVPKQTALVQSILEEKASDKEGKLIVETRKVSHLIEDELDITEAMIKLCGLTIERSGAGLLVTGNPDAFLALTALYVALFVLKNLSE